VLSLNLFTGNPYKTIISSKILSKSTLFKKSFRKNRKALTFAQNLCSRKNSEYTLLNDKAIVGSGDENKLFIYVKDGSYI